MAKLSSDGTYVIVEQGDTLSEIARDYAGGASNYKKLAAIEKNNIKDPNLIYVGQKIYLTDDAGSSGSSSSTSNNETKAVIKQFGLVSNAENTLFATWTWGKESNTASYKVKWTYSTGDGVWFNGNDGSITVDKDDRAAARQSTYSIPSNATAVKFKVKPISETYEKNNVQTSYWTAEWSNEETFDVANLPPKAPSSPSVTMEKYRLTATLDNLDLDATKIEFQVIKDNSTVFGGATIEITYGHVSYSCEVTQGGEYKVRCRSSRDSLYSDWSPYSNSVGTIPSSTTGITTIRAESKTSVYLEWAEASGAESYDIEYTTKKEYFDASNQTTSINDVKGTHYTVVGLDSGSEYFFRVRAGNTRGESSWCEPKSIIIGTTPSAPTTWSSTTKAIVGEDVILYWVHNSEDGSSEKLAQLEIYMDGVKQATHNITKSDDENEKDKTSNYVIDTSSYKEGVTIQWRVRTAGVTLDYGEWSVQRTIEVHARPTVELSVKDQNGRVISTVTSFPFYIYALGGPKSQRPLSYHIDITSGETYDTVDSIGNETTVSKGDSVYSKHFDVNDSILIEMSAGNIDLENNVTYTVTCTVAMDSGLTATNTTTFRVSWTDMLYSPDAEIGIDTDTMTALIRPYCENRVLTRYVVTYGSRVYTRTNNTVRSVFGTPIKGAKTTDGHQVYDGTTSSGEDIYYCEVETTTPVTDVYLAVYRREFDGSFIEIASGLDSAKNVTVTDPHPALDLARYRIVATSKTTGAVSYYDPAGYPVGGKAVIIQWAENWSSFETNEAGSLVEPTWAGSMLKLPYNIDVSDNNKPDVALIEYIGRPHPVSYYGTQIGSSATWNVEIDKKDEETLYALRRLSRWMGDVYVREPSGSGYWANITVSFSQKHCEVTIPVNLSVTRVEGGM